MLTYAHTQTVLERLHALAKGKTESGSFAHLENVGMGEGSVSDTHFEVRQRLCVYATATAAYGCIRQHTSAYVSIR